MSVMETLPRDPVGTNCHRGLVARDVISEADQLYVTMPDFHPSLMWGPCKWQRRAGTLPARGDTCLVVMDNADQPWVPAWWPERGDLPVTGGVSTSFTQTIGDGSSTTFDISHNLGVADVVVMVREAAGNQSFVFPEIRHVDNNTTRLLFTDAPTSGQYRVLITGGAFTQIIDGSIEGRKLNLHYGTAPPSSPNPGDRWVYMGDACAWEFVYRPVEDPSFPWYNVGGGSLFAEVAGLLMTTSASYVDLGGPSLVVPRSGSYEIIHGANIGVGTAGYAKETIKLGGAAPADAERVESYSTVTGGSNQSLSRTMVRTLAAADVLKMYYAGGGGGTNANWQCSFIALRPRRVS